jgi:sec-independent protein translocase protein TatB
MYLFIFDSIGTSELLLIALVALIFLGPRRLPEMARKFGKIMNEFRRTTSEFKQTWEREVTSEVDQIKNEAKVFSFPDDADTAANTISKNPAANANNKAVAPAIKEVSKEDFDQSVSKENLQKEEKIEAEDDLAAKQNWL